MQSCAIICCGSTCTWGVQISQQRREKEKRGNKARHTASTRNGEARKQTQQRRQMEKRGNKTIREERHLEVHLDIYLHVSVAILDQASILIVRSYSGSSEHAPLVETRACSLCCQENANTAPRCAGEKGQAPFTPICVNGASGLRSATARTFPTRRVGETWPEQRQTS